MAASPTAGVPLCDIQAQYHELKPEFEAALAHVLESGQVILGPEVAALEEEVARYCGVAYGVACGSGTDALSLALHALEIGPGDEVILPTFTFFATGGAVCRTGAKPVFVDIDPITYNLDPFQVESKITPRTRAILPVHLFGQCADMECLWNIAERHDLAIIEDAAQSLGAEYQGKRGQSRRHGLSQFLSNQKPRRLRRRRYGGDQRSRLGGAWPASAFTAWSRNTITNISAGTAGLTLCRRPCCASSCRIWTAGWRRGKRRRGVTTV